MNNDNFNASQVREQIRHRLLMIRDALKRSMDGVDELPYTDHYIDDQVTRIKRWASEIGVLLCRQQTDPTSSPATSPATSPVAGIGLPLQKGDQLPADLVRELLDLDQFREESGYTNDLGCICPRCKRLVSKGLILEDRGIIPCPGCGKSYRFVKMDLHGRELWSTFAEVTRP